MSCDIPSGIWFYGLAGSGKTHASITLCRNLENGFLIDGDTVRSEISFDLGYTIEDREIQIRRLFGLAKITINNNFFPIVSSVYMDENVHNMCRKIGILVIQIERNIEEIVKIRPIYKEQNDVVGKDIELPSLTIKTIYNDGSVLFEREVIALVQ